MRAGEIVPCIQCVQCIYNEGWCTLVNLSIAVTAFALQCTLHKMHYKMYIENYAFHQVCCVICRYTVFHGTMLKLKGEWELSGGDWMAARFDFYKRITSVSTLRNQLLWLNTHPVQSSELQYNQLHNGPLL